MPTGKPGIIYFEQGATLTEYEAMTNSGDNQHFTSSANIWSGESGKAPEIRPNGITSGLNVLSVAASGSDDVIDVASFKAFSMGVEHDVAADTDFAITRPATDVAKVCSVTMTSAGALAEVAGTDGATTTFSTVRGASGGPPEIPTDSIEVGQVRMTSSTSAAIAASEIYQTTGQHSERYDYPAMSYSNLGHGQSASVSAQTYAHVKFSSSLPLIHSSATPKKVYVQFYEPTFAEISKAYDFQPAETTHTVSTTEYYRGQINSTASSVGQGQFIALLEDGVKDAIVAAKNKILTIKFQPDENKAPYILTQGKLAITRSFQVASQIQATVVINPEEASSDFSG